VGSYVKIELLKAGTMVRILASGTANDGSFGEWITPSNLETGTDYRIRITSTTNTAITDSSNSNFAITSTTTSPSITVSSPNGGESWARDSTHIITWSSSGSVGSNVKIEALKAGAVVQTITSSTPNDGSYNAGWTIPATLATGTDYRIRITSTTNTAITDSSNSNFAITSTTTSPSITVSSPNGGDSLPRMMGMGSPYPIKWSYSGNVGTAVKIELLKAGILDRVITTSTSIGSAGTGSYAWQIPATVKLGNDYKIRVTSTSNSAYSDTSNTNFIIN
jgi:hypothetical protein